MEKLLKSIKEAEKQEGKLSSACNNVLNEILKYIEFEPKDNAEYYGFVIEPTTDGITLADTFAKVYNMEGILKHIKDHGKIKSYSQLQQFSI